MVSLLQMGRVTNVSCADSEIWRIMELLGAPPLPLEPHGGPATPRPVLRRVRTPACVRDEAVRPSPRGHAASLARTPPSGRHSVGVICAGGKGALALRHGTRAGEPGPTRSLSSWHDHAPRCLLDPVARPHS
jgi:hypothetical protein